MPAVCAARSGIAISSKDGFERCDLAPVGRATIAGNLRSRVRLRNSRRSALPVPVPLHPEADAIQQPRRLAGAWLRVVAAGPIAPRDGIPRGDLAAGRKPLGRRDRSTARAG